MDLYSVLEEQDTQAWRYKLIRQPKKPKNCTAFSEYDQLKKEEAKMDKDALYEIKRGDETLFAHKLGVNSQGRWVIEVKGSGEVLAVNKDIVSEVLPYTVNLKFGKQGKDYAYFDEKRSVKKGDVLVVDDYDSGGYQLAIVTGIDTKSRRAAKELSFYVNLGGA